MNQNLFSRFNVYDQIGYVMVGAVALLLLVFNAVYFFQTLIPPLTIDTFLAWFIIAYVMGHLVQGISNLITDTRKLKNLIPEEKNGFDERDKAILMQAKEYFGLEERDESKLWNLCYMLACAKDITGQVQSFNSYCSLYRGWFILFLLESLFIISLLLISFSWNVLMLFVISVSIAAIFRRRFKRFWKYTTKKVLETFIIIKALKI